MSFNAIFYNKILAKISEFTVCQMLLISIYSPRFMFILHRPLHQARQRKLFYAINYPQQLVTINTQKKWFQDTQVKYEHYIYICTMTMADVLKAA